MSSGMSKIRKSKKHNENGHMPRNEYRRYLKKRLSDDLDGCGLLDKDKESED